MSIFKRGRVYWYHFVFNGQHIQRVAKQGNPRVARQMEAAHKTSLARGETGFRERKKVALGNFLKDEFLPFVESKFKAVKPRTLRYYQYGAKTLRESDFRRLKPRRNHRSARGLLRGEEIELSPSR